MKNYLRFKKYRSLNTRFLLILILFFAFFLRIYQLDALPGEMWGDIIEGYKFSEQILQGKWPFYFVLGNGPLFFYLGQPLFILFGLSFFTLKLLSVFSGILLVIGSYLLAKYLFNEKIALICAFLLSVSKWPLIFSRLGNMNILVPVFVVFIFYYFFIVVNKKDLKSFLSLSILTGIGIYNYPSFVFVPITLSILFTYIIIKDFTFLKQNFLKILISIGIFVFLTIPFIRLLPDFGFTEKDSYFGSKFFDSEGNYTDSIPTKFVINSVNSLAMFHFKGDEVFRVNVKNQPQLDVVSGFFLIIGLIYLISDKKWRKYSIYLITPFLILQLPAILVLNFPNEIPSATRSIGILPFLYIFIALGIYFLFVKTKGFKSMLLLFVILTLIFIINTKNVFIDYAQGLPNINTPFGKIIARELDKLPVETKVYVIGCCWGEWGYPDSDSIKHALFKKRYINFITKEKSEKGLSCGFIDQSLVKGNYYLVVDPYYTSLINTIKNCYFGSEKLITANGFKVAWTYSLF